MLAVISICHLQVLEFDLSDVGIVEERTPSTMETAVLPSDTHGENPLTHPAQVFIAAKYPKYRFKHFNDDNIFDSIVQICQLLGCYGNLSLLVDHFLDMFHESATHQKQVVFILNEVIRGYCGIDLATTLSPVSGKSANVTYFISVIMITLNFLLDGVAYSQIILYFM